MWNKIKEYINNISEEELMQYVVGLFLLNSIIDFALLLILVPYNSNAMINSVILVILTMIIIKGGTL